MINKITCMACGRSHPMSGTGAESLEVRAQRQKSLAGPQEALPSELIPP